ncbi:1-acyl-sn-glycerol-3-phosphate acyltransferase [Rubrivivax sp. JA1024]|nr:1-acyl-sn-glycerol-3-phosphate acyltransferase [Rubrivivax sp. JA1024]
MFVIFLRSLIFNVLFYLLLVGWLIVAIPTFLLPRRALIKVAKMWGQSSIWLMRLVCGTRVEFRGLEKIPPGPLIVAPKHQSMWETFALLQFFDAPLYILKRELTWIPVFGWLLVKADMIAINRRKGGRILMEMAKSASREVNRGRQLIIFPEGTRTPVDAPPHYKAGVAQIYADCDVPCLPVALNSGLFWPRRQFMRYPGTIVVEFLDPLPAGLERREFLTRVSAAIETASNRLIAEARKEQAELFGRVPSATSHQAKQAPKPERGQAG